MNQATSVVRGTIRPDGTLELDERLNLPAGQVEVTIRPVVAESKGENWFENLERIRAEREAAGYPFRSKEEIDADREEDQDWDEARLEEARGRGKTEPPTPTNAEIESKIPSTPGKVPAETLLELMLRTRAELEASGLGFRTQAEIEADQEDLRDWVSGLDEIRRQAEESRRRVDSQ